MLLCCCRPQRLLVFVNPYGGKRQARRIWSKLAEPILTAAGVSCDLVETQHQVGPVWVC
jgi:diacylglycerol kinase family enzyme